MLKHLNVSVCFNYLFTHNVQETKITNWSIFQVAYRPTYMYSRHFAYDLVLGVNFYQLKETFKMRDRSIGVTVKVTPETPLLEIKIFSEMWINPPIYCFQQLLSRANIIDLHYRLSLCGCYSAEPASVLFWQIDVRLYKIKNTYEKPWWIPNWYFCLFCKLKLSKAF